MLGLDGTFPELRQLHRDQDALRMVQGRLAALGFTETLCR